VGKRSDNGNRWVSFFKHAPKICKHLNWQKKAARVKPDVGGGWERISGLGLENSIETG